MKTLPLFALLFAAGLVAEDLPRYRWENFTAADGLAHRAVLYRPALDTRAPEMLVRDAEGKVSRAAVASAPAHNYTFGVDFQGKYIWVATARDVSHGIRLDKGEDSK
jgi:hypothetical protein